ncbi:MAG: hypothetical protein ACXW20_13430 [Burkholderiales bacterium]
MRRRRLVAALHARVIGAAVALVLTAVLIAVAAGLERRANAIDRTQPANRTLY